MVNDEQQVCVWCKATGPVYVVQDDDYAIPLCLACCERLVEDVAPNLEDAQLQLVDAQAAYDANRRAWSRRDRVFFLSSNIEEMGGLLRQYRAGVEFLSRGVEVENEPKTG